MTAEDAVAEDQKKRIWQENVVVYATTLRRVEFDECCHGPLKYQSFARLTIADPWMHLSEHATQTEAVDACEDEQSLSVFGLTELERQRALRDMADAKKAEEDRQAAIEVRVDGELLDSPPAEAAP